MKYIKFLTLTASIALLSACQAVDGTLADLGVDQPVFESTAQIPPSEDLIGGGKCPRVRIVNELSALSEFTNMDRPREDQLISRAHVGTVDAACEYGPKSVTVDLQLAFESVLGPEARVTATDKPFFSYPFFVAVSEPGGEILAKEIFAAAMTFPPGQNRQTYTEKLRQIIPAPNQERGARYQVVVGFQLSEEQLKYNRRIIAQMEEARERAEKLERKNRKIIAPLTGGPAEAVPGAVDTQSLEAPASIMPPKKR
jgi:hypothetical protein